MNLLRNGTMGFFRSMTFFRDSAKLGAFTELPLKKKPWMNKARKLVLEDPGKLKSFV